MWTQFWDMHSGGGCKEEWSQIYIEASEPEARIIFYNKFGHNPSRVSCTCCGEDYDVSESPSLEEATAFDRRGASLAEYEAESRTLIIRAGDINLGWRSGEVPEQGCVWYD